MRVLIPGYDHSLYEADVYEEQVIWDTKHDRYYEYGGEELEEHEKLVLREVAR